MFHLTRWNIIESKHNSRHALPGTHVSPCGGVLPRWFIDDYRSIIIERVITLLSRCLCSTRYKDVITLPMNHTRHRPSATRANPREPPTPVSESFDSANRANRIRSQVQRGNSLQNGSSRVTAISSIEFDDTSVLRAAADHRQSTL